MKPFKTTQFHLNFSCSDSDELKLTHSYSWLYLQDKGNTVEKRNTLVLP